MKISILKSETNTYAVYEIEKCHTLLSALDDIKANIDNSLTFGAGCRASICGSCSVRVNGKEVLACEYKPQEADKIEPLNYHKVLRDLKVDKSKALKSIVQASAFLHQSKEASLSIKNVKQTQVQSDCILCSSCYSACPVFSVNSDFIGPFALSRAFKYSNDPREENSKECIDSIQNMGIWDCTLCGECTLACPKGIDPKTDILMLRGQSLDFGYVDPSFSTLSFDAPSFL